MNVNRSASARTVSRWGRHLLVGLLIGQLAPVAQAWNESAHRIIAASAARQMSPELQATVAAALRAHPRYDKDLDAYRPRKLGELSEVEWLMGQAAQWPDRARRFNNEPFYKRDKLVETYHRGRWHYINLPIYLAKADSALRIENPTRSVDTDKPDNVLSALEFLRLQLRDPTVSLADKGLWISWALHLIADVHQPLHTTAMFSKERWPKGDRGGNSVKIKGSGKKNELDTLHYYWDSAISNVRKPWQINRLVGVLNEQALPKLAKDEILVKNWIEEGNWVAKNMVYGPLLTQLRASPVVSIDKKYTRRAHSAALKRGALAARRTALWLEEALRI